MARRMLVLAIALFLAAVVIRNAAVAALADRSPDAAARVWRGHPRAEIALGMTQIGRAARDRKSLPASIFAAMNDAATKAPLAPEPFLVRGVQLQTQSQASAAIEAFEAAARRDPRSLPAHYFLADALFRSGDMQRGLREIGVLARLAPGGATSIAPYVATSARDRRTWPQLRELFRTEPPVAEAALTALAADPANADIVLGLADAKHRGPNAIWLRPLLNGLVAAGQYARARQIWTDVSRGQGSVGELLHDGQFAEPSSPPPFNWTLNSSTVGLAERVPRGGLHVIFYGNDDGVLVRQLLVLPAGAYRISMTAAGNDLRTLNWSIRCDRSQAPISAARLDLAVSRRWGFRVPAGCPAQWIELSGVSSDVARQSEVTIRNLRLSPDRSDG